MISSLKKDLVGLAPLILLGVSVSSCPRCQDRQVLTPPRPALQSGAFQYTDEAIRKTENVGAEYLRLLRQGEFQRTYALLSSGYRKAYSLAHHSQQGRLLVTRMRQGSQIRLAGRAIGTYPNSPHVRLVYQVSHGPDTAHLALYVVPQGGSWFINSIHFPFGIQSAARGRAASTAGG